MGDVADDMMDEAAEWEHESSFCRVHRVRYLNRLGCLACEDGEPAPVVHCFCCGSDYMPRYAGKMGVCPRCGAGVEEQDRAAHSAALAARRRQSAALRPVPRPGVSDA